MGEDPDWRGSSSSSTISFIRRFTLLITFLLILPATEGHVICGSIDIRNDARTVFNKENASDEFIARYSNCTILEGTFSLSMITNSSTKEEEFVTFPNLVEITGYLLVFNVKSLTTLSRIFPNLRVIGGSQLIMNYALIIYQNPDLKDVGLPNLRVIRNGGVRISENPSLCFVVQIDWPRLAVGQIDDVHVADGESSGAVCTDHCDDLHGRCLQRNDGKGVSCWSATTCQENCPFDKSMNTTKRAGPGCVIGAKNYTACHPECIGGCYEENEESQCVACAGFLYDGKCVSRCPSNMFEYLSRCVTQEQCTESPEVRIDDEWRQYKAVNNQCTYDCPPGFEQKKYSIEIEKGVTKVVEYCEVCKGNCPKKCKGKALDTIAMAKELEGCNVVEGNLDIQLKDNSKMTMLTEYLKDIEVIEGHLLIRFSPSLTSLSIFQKLKEIRGTELFQDRYALVIYENTNLNSLFSDDVNKRLNITSGHVQVQNNRMLCFKHVKSLMDELEKKTYEGDNRMKFDQDDQSTYSNGDKAICDETTLTLSYEKLMSEGFILKWSPLNTSDIDHRKFLGYQVFYKRVETNDVSAVHIEQDRSVCSDTWNMHFEPEKTKGDEKKEENITLTINEERTMLMNPPADAATERAGEVKKKMINGLDSKLRHAVITHDDIVPNALYAAYVQTKMVNHLGAKNARSNVIIVETQFSNPTPPRIMSIISESPTTLKVEWEEPARPNGNITHYIISWTPQNRDISFEVKHACDYKNRHASVIHQSVPSTTAAPTTSPAASFSEYVSTEKPSSDTCQAKGCCSCSNRSPSSVSSLHGINDDEETDDLDNNHDFENAVQNIVFVPSQESERVLEPKGEARKKRSISLANEYKEDGNSTKENDDIGKDSNGATNMKEEEKKKINEKDSRVIDGVIYAHLPGFLLRQVANQTVGTQNHTATADKKQTFIITGLNHATTYQVSVTACQDIDVEPHFCSLKPAYKSQRTEIIKENDMVFNITTEILNTTTNAVVVHFETPNINESNGRIFGVGVTLVNVNDPNATHPYECVNSATFAGGATFYSIADGTYIPSIVTFVGHGVSEEVKGTAFTVKSPSIFTWPVILVALLIIFILISVVAFIVMQTTRTMIGKKVGEYVRNTITANPDYETYLSQQDVYKADEWELERSNLVLGEEIGRGTFGKVYRGWGDQIKSQCGIVFSECAVKTVSDEANPSERFHFLIEASVMKQFNSSFIIHLFGVVSDGQPVLVVMEMMAKGNLRDYLRSRRPDGEENLENLPVPTDTEIMEWAAQIADGMAYLEHLKFCHRDLAARNCMIGADDVVKIGDFGMARDIYYHEYYKPTGKRMMPVRWMAPESLKDGKFSLKSDVWSYGIVLYEMMTLAQQPYQGLANDEVFNYIGVTRRVLDRPQDCPDFWYELMLHCWNYQPKERPSFRQIVECLCLNASDDFKQRSWVLNEAPLAEGEIDDDGRHDYIVDSDARDMFCNDNRLRRKDEEDGERGVELMNSEEEDSV